MTDKWIDKYIDKKMMDGLFWIPNVSWSVFAKCLISDGLLESGCIIKVLNSPPGLIQWWSHILMGLFGSGRNRRYVLFEGSGPQ